MKALEMRSGGLQSVLCLGAHADDIEIGCAGTILQLLEHNPELKVHWVVLSAPGDRKAEAEQSAQTILAGASDTDIRVADFEETVFPYAGTHIKRYVAELGTQVSPDLVLTHWRRDLHQDHRMVGELTWNTFRDHLILEYEIPKWDGDMGRPNTYVPLDRSLCERKIEHLLKAFPSQADKDWFSSEVFWALLRLRGMEARSQSGYAEAFFCRKLVLG
jgi:LmbE family N-acetylglucosaminyl deacetylase